MLELKHPTAREEEVQSLSSAPGKSKSDINRLSLQNRSSIEASPGNDHKISTNILTLICWASVQRAKKKAKHMQFWISPRASENIDLVSRLSSTDVLPDGSIKSTNTIDHELVDAAEDLRKSALPMFTLSTKASKTEECSSRDSARPVAATKRPDGTGMSVWPPGGA